MSKLLVSYFSRLKKSKLFWAECIFIFVLGLYLVGNKYWDLIKYKNAVQLDNGLFAYTIVIGFAMAMFCSLFLGTEYSDGTIRNKIVVGHPRIRIYFASLIVNLAAAFFMCLCFLIPVLVVGIFLVGPLEMEFQAVLGMLLGSFCLTAAFCAIFTMTSMVWSSKAAVAVTGMMWVVLFLAVAGIVNSKLEAPEYVTNYTMSESGQLELYTEPNPKYLKDKEREIYQLIYDLLPTGQALQFAFLKVVNLWRLPLYSLFVFAVFTLLGSFLFVRKDIK